MSRPSSPAAEPPPLEIDDLLVKILLRLPPLPFSLPRASAVCKRWRALVSDRRFVRRFRIRHHRNPPLLGCFGADSRNILFEPALEAPNRIPPCRLSFPIHVDGHPFVLRECRHGLMLHKHGGFLNTSRNQLLVWDSVIGDQHLLDIPPGLENSRIVEAVLRAAGDVRCFRVVLIGDMGHSQRVAYVYSSERGVWGNVITGPLPPDDPTPAFVDSPGFYHGMSSVMVGDSLYWLYSGNSPAIIEFDLARQSLALVPMPVDEAVGNGNRNMLVMPAEGGGLGFLFLTGFGAQLWKRKKDCDGVVSWVLGRSIQLYNLLSLKLDPHGWRPYIIGFAEDNIVVFLKTSTGVFTAQLESLQFKKIFVSYKDWYYCIPYEVVYTADKGIDGGGDGAELLQNI